MVSSIHEGQVLRLTGTLRPAEAAYEETPLRDGSAQGVWLQTEARNTPED